MTDVVPGRRVKVVQTIARRAGDWRTEVVGILLSADPQPTGSWFAHGKDDRFWLARLVIQRDDGEITELVMDQRTRIEALDV